MQPIDLNKMHEPVSASRYAVEREQTLKTKYNMPNGLILEGAASRQSETTVDDFVRQGERDQLKNMKLAVGRTMYQGKPIKLWFDVSR